jgi:hypothetical protein
MSLAFRATEWKFFAGAAILTVALLAPWAPMSDVVGGIALAAVINWKLFRSGKVLPTQQGQRMKD